MTRMPASYSAEGPPDEIAYTILTALSAAADVEIASLHPPLFDVIDSDALEQLLESADERLRVTFPYEQWVVEVHGGGSVTVTQPGERQ